MRLDYFLNEKANLKAAVLLLMFVSIVIGAATVYNALKLNRIVESSKTILVPVGLNTMVEIDNDRVSDEYLRVFIRHISSLAFTYTPSTARKNFKELVILFSPETRSVAEQQFYDLADKIEKTKTSVAFYLDIDKSKIKQDQKIIEIVGLRKQFASDVPIEDSAKTYNVYFRVENSKFMLTKISEKEGVNQ